MGKWVPLGVKMIMVFVFILGLAFFGAGPPPAGTPLDSKVIHSFDGDRCTEDPYRDDANLIRGRPGLESYLTCALDADSEAYNRSLQVLIDAAENETLIALDYSPNCSDMEIRGVWVEDDDYHIGLLETLPSWWEGCVSPGGSQHHFMVVDNETAISSIDVMVAHKEPLWILDACILTLFAGAVMVLVYRGRHRIVRRLPGLDEE